MFPIRYRRCGKVLFSQVFVCSGGSQHSSRCEGPLYHIPYSIPHHLYTTPPVPHTPLIPHLVYPKPASTPYSFYTTPPVPHTPSIPDTPFYPCTHPSILHLRYTTTLPHTTLPVPHSSLHHTSSIPHSLYPTPPLYHIPCTPHPLYTTLPVPHTPARDGH